ncbi:nucleoside recognition domain-containing protein [Marinicrinis lubricantis]|uniref:Nucleoside recognition domain-containing protein n=1 Tax=Marinicrinis lubricantis TaxID=2086470 RepID=A0ABW1IMJ7_9BACL
MPRFRYIKGRAATFLIAAVLLAVAASIVMFPEQAFQASLKALNIWWEIVFPGLLPFFILTEISAAFGILHALGVLIAPIMQSLFRLPGISGWAAAFGWTAGYAAGAEMTAKLRKQGWISRQEGQKLLVISHLTSPVTLFGIVAVGFFLSPSLGWLLFIAQCISILAIGMLYPIKKEPKVPDDREAKPAKPVSLWQKMLDAADRGREEDGRSFGKVLGDAVTLSVQNLMLIGGTMMIFSVISGSVEQLLFRDSFAPFGMEARVWIHLIVSSLFEVHLGAFAASSADMLLPWQAAFTSALLTWSGLALHFQVKSIISETDLSYVPFLWSKIAQSLISFFVILILWEPFKRLSANTAPAFHSGPRETPSAYAPPDIWTLWKLEAQWLFTVYGGLILVAILAFRLHPSRNRTL